jgi:hypothetical protein
MPSGISPVAGARWSGSSRCACDALAGRKPPEDVVQQQHGPLARRQLLDDRDKIELHRLTGRSAAEAAEL